MGSLTLANMADKVKYVQFLHDASEIRFSTGSNETKNDINLQLPVSETAGRDSGAGGISEVNLLIPPLRGVGGCLLMRSYIPLPPSKGDF